MPELLLALLILWALVYGARWFARANPAVVARVVKRGGGTLSLVGAGLLLLRGRLDIALGLGSLGVWLLGWSGRSSFYRFSWPRGGSAAGGGARLSRVRSAMIEMELDHDSGTMQGTVLAGAFEGCKLASLTRPQCEGLYRTCLADDPEGARLLEAYLDRRFAGWRAAGQGHGDAGSGSVGANAMSEDEAYEVLGLPRGASREEVTAAHRSLMKKLHPDHGGSTNLAARVNQAKDVLMRRHT